MAENFLSACQYRFHNFLVMLMSPREDEKQIQSVGAIVYTVRYEPRLLASARAEKTAIS